MNDPVVQNNQNLVLNGDFNDRLKEWRPSGMIGLAREFYADELVNFMEVGVGASATQVIKAPKTPGARAGYELTFLCELRPGVSWSGESGWLHIRKSGDVLMSIELTKTPDWGRSSRWNSSRGCIKDHWTNWRSSKMTN
jgi:hypothetical protein